MAKTFLTKIVVIFSILVAASAAFAQNGLGTRSITSDDFASQRLAASPSGVKAAVKARRITYKFVRADKNPVRHRGRKRAETKALPEKITEIGITMWKMRAPRPSEKNLVLLPVLDNKEERKMWLAERVDTGAVFQAGDRVRFAIESSDSGYLYVIGRETYSDGSYGVPYAVFPASPADDNSVRPGMLFDFPDQREDLPYLKLNPKRPKYSGELLTVIISPKPLTTLKIDVDGKLKDADELGDLEFGSDAEVFTRTDTADRFYSKAESDSSCGVKSRELVREKSPGNPCGASHLLTRGEPLPQSIYRVKGLAGQPAVAFLKLTVK